MLRFTLWLRAFVEDHVEPLLNLRQSTSPEGSRGTTGACTPDHPTAVNPGSYAIASEFREAMERRRRDFEWFCGEAPIAADLCHPLYNVSSPFIGFTGLPHRDAKDSYPTILLNFGFARLHLPEYEATVDLHPGELVFFNAGVLHYSTRHPKYDRGPDTDRWAVSCFFQKHIHSRKRATSTRDAADLQQAAKAPTPAETAAAAVIVMANAGAKLGTIPNNPTSI